MTKKRVQSSHKEIQLHRPSRIIIDRVSPCIDGGRFAAKVYQDEGLRICAMVLVDGHETAKAKVLLRKQDEKKIQVFPMKFSGNDEWVMILPELELGRYEFSVEASIDRFGTWCADMRKRIDAGQNVSVDLIIGENILQEIQPGLKSEKMKLDAAIQKLRGLGSTGIVDREKFEEWSTEASLTKITDNHFDQISTVRLEKYFPIQVESQRARFSSWYEFFPRSTGTPHGSFKTSEPMLKRAHELGFNVVYLPPIHPVGKNFRKGKNNTLNALADDVGSPWAIGGQEGGHKAIHPDLGTFKDFERFLNTAKSLGLEIALDIAFQCSPDHPYVKDHPQWFKQRPDGTIQYAENPPKKYQDIYPFDFETADWQSLWEELYSVVNFWVEKGIKIFRVDNPHTKSFHFWEWLIARIKKDHPEVIFLSEAFTRPKIMAYLAKIGFTQSYTYFTWRNEKWELTEYMNELTKTELADFFMPNFWPNTPDILPYALQKGAEATFKARLALAATLSSSYGIYGPAYEYLIHEPFAAGKEEYLHSEKYEVYKWDQHKKRDISDFIKLVNKIRNEEKALQSNRHFRFHEVDNKQLIAYSKTQDHTHIITVVNLDGENPQSGWLELPLLDWHLPQQDSFLVTDLLTGQTFQWKGWRNYVELRLDLPVHILKVTTPPYRGER